MEVSSAGQRKLTDCDTILFLGHSAGGIIARHVLTSNLRVFRDKRIGLALLGSPSKGSKWAIVADNIFGVAGFRTLAAPFRGKQLVQLTTYSRLLIALDAQFQLLLDYELLHVVGREFMEHRGVFGKAKVVGDSSAAVYFPEPIMIADSNHSSLVDPGSCDSQMYQEFVRLWYDLLDTDMRESGVTSDIRAELRSEADVGIFRELNSILSIQDVANWRDWVVGSSYYDAWFTPLWRMEHRSQQPDCSFHDTNLNRFHLDHIAALRAFTSILAQENVDAGGGRGRIDKSGKGVPSESSQRRDKYDELREKVEEVYCRWLEAYDAYIRAAKEHLIV